MQHELMIGTDPEFFLKDKYTKKMIASQGVVPGTKEEPYKLKNGMVHRDNVAVEIGIPPAKTKEQFYQSITETLDEVQKLLSSNLELKVLSSAHFEFDQLDNIEAAVFGCEGDFDAWGIENVKAPDPFAIPTLRSAGGHVHLGWCNDGKVVPTRKRVEVARACDIFIGLRGVFYDQDQERRKLYGRASRVRWKPYGIEYRTPSNWWLSSRENIERMFSWAQDAYYKTDILQRVSDEMVMDIKEAINTGNTKQAATLLDFLEVAYAA